MGIFFCHYDHLMHRNFQNERLLIVYVVPKECIVHSNTILCVSVSGSSLQCNALGQCFVNKQLDNAFFYDIPCLFTSGNVHNMKNVFLLIVFGPFLVLVLVPVPVPILIPVPVPDQGCACYQSCFFGPGLVPSFKQNCKFRQTVPLGHDCRAMRSLHNTWHTTHSFRHMNVQTTPTGATLVPGRLTIILIDSIFGQSSRQYRY